MRQHEPQRPNDVRGLRQQHLALTERLTNEPESIVLKIAKAAMNQLGAGRTRSTAEVAFIREQDAQASAGRVGSDATSIYATTDDGEIICIRRSHVWRLLMGLEQPVRYCRFRATKPAAFGIPSPNACSPFGPCSATLDREETGL